MAPLSELFSASYAQARQRFMQAATAAGLQVQSLQHPLPGSEGEELAMDLAWLGPRHAASVLVISSACHGVEGYAGSAAQLSLLRDARWRRSALAGPVSLLFIHALNPYGFSWTRRVTEDNVDLNRNFVDFAGHLPRNRGYEEVAALLLPEAWPPSADVQQAIGTFIARRGIAAWHAAVAGGQYSHANGLFYGGARPGWSHLSLRRVLREQLSYCARLGWVDLHTGLGACGHGERMLLDVRASDSVERARSWWGPAVTTLEDGGGSSAAPASGLLCAAIRNECPQAEYTGIALEFGTVPPEQVLEALRAEQWLHAHPGQLKAATAADIKQALREAFYIETSDWQRAVLAQSREAVQLALSGLAG